MTFGIRQSRAALAVVVALAMVSLTACARKDGGAPLTWGGGYIAPTETKLQPVRQSGMQVVRVQRGDTLLGIAHRYDISERELIQENGLLSPYKLIAGQTLVVPKSRYHTVTRGDTIYSLSRGYNLTVADVTSRNDLKPPYTIKVGQRLLLPSKAGSWPTEQIEGEAVRSETRVAAVAAPAKKSGPVKKPESSFWGDIALPESKPTKPRPELFTASIPKQTARTDGFLWPVSGRVISGYGPKQNGLHNDGINIAVSKGAPVRAAQSGVVTYAGNELKGYGNLLLIKHADGYVTAYAHNQKLLVRRGEKVRQGDVIAEAGATGSVTSPQVHFEIRKGRSAINPNKYLSGA